MKIYRKYDKININGIEYTMTADPYAYFLTYDMPETAIEYEDGSGEVDASIEKDYRKIIRERIYEEVNVIIKLHIPGLPAELEYLHFVYLDEEWINKIKESGLNPNGEDDSFMLANMLIEDYYTSSEIEKI